MGKNNTKLAFEKVKAFIEQQEGYILLSTEYVRVHSRLEIQCPKGHRYKVTFANFQTGNRCPYCAGRKVSYQMVKEYVGQYEGTLLTAEYKGHQEPLEVECENGHRWTTTWRNLNQCNKLGCRQCVIENVTLSFENVKENIETKGCKLLSTEYKNAHTKLLIECDKGHRYSVTWNKFKDGCRCPECSESNGERMVSEILSELNVDFVKEEGLGKFSLDFYIPSLSLAIEYDGEHHFRPVCFGGMSKEKAEEEFKKTQQRDEEKNSLCEKRGIRLVRIAHTKKYDDVVRILDREVNYENQIHQTVR